jgi:hypothetical protein
MTDSGVKPLVDSLVEHRRELERLRKREARKRQTPEQREHERARKRKDRERLTAAQRECERVRKREARMRRAPNQRESERMRKREARMRQTPEQREREKEREARRCRRKEQPFLAIDGEGGGTDAFGRQHYLLMIASGTAPQEKYMLHRDGKPLSTRDCLEFILSLPPKRKIVGYGFGYDATQMLRGIFKQSTLRQILNPRQGKKRTVLYLLGRLRHQVPTRAVF